MPISSEVQGLVLAAMDASDGIVAVLQTDAQGGLCFFEVGEALLRLLGRGQVYLLDQPLAIIAAPEAADELRSIATAVAGGVSCRGELACQDAAGRRIWLGYHIMPRHSETMTGQFYVLLARDITRRRQEEDGAKMLSTMLAKALLVVDVPLMIVSAEGHVVVANYAMERLLKHKTGALAGTPALNYVAPAYQARVQATRELQMENGVDTQSDIELLASDGALHRVLLSSTVMERADRQRLRVLTVHVRPPAASEAPASQVAGRMRFVSLQALQARLGERWERVGPRIMQSAAEIIQHCLGTSDTVEQDRPCAFSICFSGLTEAEASKRASAIARELRQQLIGQGEDEDALMIQVVIADVPLRPDAPAAGQITMYLDEAEASAERAEAAPPPAQILFLTASRGQTALYIPAPAASRQRFVEPEAPLAVDLACLEAMVLAASGRSAMPLLVSAHFATLLKRTTADAYQEACGQAARQIGRPVFVVLSPIPKGATQSMLQEVTRRLKPLVAGIGFHLDMLAPPQVDLRACPISWAVADLAPWRGGETVPADRMRRLADLLGAYNARLLAINASSMDVFPKLHECGVHAATCVGRITRVAGEGR